MIWLCEVFDDNDHKYTGSNDPWNQNDLISIPSSLYEPDNSTRHPEYKINQEINI